MTEQQNKDESGLLTDDDYRIKQEIENNQNTRRSYRKHFKTKKGIKKDGK